MGFLLGGLNDGQHKDVLLLHRGLYSAASGTSFILPQSYRLRVRSPGWRMILRRTCDCRPSFRGVAVVSFFLCVSTCWHGGGRGPPATASVPCLAAPLVAGCSHRLAAPLSWRYGCNTSSLIGPTFSLLRPGYPVHPSVLYWPLFRPYRSRDPPPVPSAHTHAVS